MQKMKRVEIAIAVGLIAAILVCFTGFAKTSEEISQDVLRLHILANSDSAEDQALKLAVRDRLRADVPELFAEAKDRDSAAAAAQERLDEIRAIVTDEIARQGYDYTCDAQIVDMYFNTREYDDFAMPAGNYRALRVTIGAAEGKNWWCVMFPPLCLPSAAEAPTVEESFSAQEAELMQAPEPQYEVKFKTLEVWEKVKDTVRGWFDGE